MRDARGGWKGADTAFLRDHLHAATAGGGHGGSGQSGRVGCGIVADPGPSGRLGGWAISGIPAEVCELPNPMSGFSKTSGPSSPPKRASSNGRSKQEKSSSRPTLSSSTGSTSCTALSKACTPAHIAPSASPGTLQPHRQSRSGGASGLPTSCRAHLRFPRAPSSKPNTTFIARSISSSRHASCVFSRVEGAERGFESSSSSDLKIVRGRAGASECVRFETRSRSRQFLGARRTGLPRQISRPRISHNSPRRAPTPPCRSRHVTGAHVDL